MNLISENLQPRSIEQLTQDLGLDAHSVEPYGWYAGKFALDLHLRLQQNPLGRLIGVTAINPTPFGEGKTIVSIGLAMALSRRGHRSIVNVREPSLAPVFGIKGGGAGGGRSKLVPTEDINLHFTGDLHAVTAANNLLAAMLDNHSKRGLDPKIDANGISWRRVLDMNDKGLAHIEVGLDDPIQAPRYETGFDLTAASEVMSVLSLASDFADLRHRLGRIVVGRSTSGEYVTAEQIGAAGAMTALLRNAARPNLVQTCEGTPAIVHAGPFANISHGNNSVVADLTALRLADYVVTESGFGSDNGALKLFDIKCRTSGVVPRAEVLVCTIRALKYHSGRFEVRAGRPLPTSLLGEDLSALREGSQNLAGHLAILQRFGIPTVVAINRFPTDTPAELQLARELATELGAERVAVIDAYSQGSEGALELADAVVEACACPSNFTPIYPLNATYEEKFSGIATKLLGAASVDFSPGVTEKLAEFVHHGFANLPVCIAKTQYSLSHDAKRLGRPTGFQLPITEVRLAAGAGYVLALTEGISLMPGLPREPAAKRIDVSTDGRITGIAQ